MSDLVPAAAQPRLGLDRLRNFTAQPAVTRALPALGLLGVAAAAALAWSTLSAPPQRAVSAGMDDAEKASVVDALQGASIAYKVDRDTGSITVGEADYHRARMILAQQGLPKSAPDAGAVLDGMPMGASRAVEDQRLRAAREQDLARTIEAIDPVKSARVHLAFETPSVFVRERSAPAASVMLRLDSGRTLTEQQVGAIAHLVSASVPGLDPTGVSIVDQSGRLLSKTGGADPIAAASDRQLEVQERVEERVGRSLEQLLTPIIGAGNFTAEVHADLDFSEVQATRESFPKDQSVIAQERGETSRDAGASEAGGIPGALANQPPPASQLSATPTQPGAEATTPAGTTAEATSESYNRTFALGREVSVTRGAVGGVKRLTVAVALREPKGKRFSQTRLADIQRLVEGAVGFDAARGDTVAVRVQPFVDLTAEETKTAWYEAAWVSQAARLGGGLIIALLLILFIGRPLLKRMIENGKARAEQIAEQRRQIGTEMQTAITEQKRGAIGGPITVDMIESAPSYSTRAELIRDFVRQDPARAALVVRDLLRTSASEDSRNG